MVEVEAHVSYRSGVIFHPFVDVIDIFDDVSLDGGLSLHLSPLDLLRTLSGYRSPLSLTRQIASHGGRPMLVIGAGEDGDDRHEDRQHCLLFFGEGVRPANQKEIVVSV